jgi:hypothetical protein
MADGATYTWEVDTLTFNNVSMSPGLATGTVITLTHDQPYQVKNVGVGGVGYFIRRNARGISIAFVLQPNAFENTVCQAALAADTAAPNGLLFPFEAKQGLSQWGGLCKIEGPPPTQEWSDTAFTYTWTLQCTRSVGTVGPKPASPVGP